MRPLSGSSLQREKEGDLSFSSSSSSSRQFLLSLSPFFSFFSFVGLLRESHLPTIVYVFPLPVAPYLKNSKRRRKKKDDDDEDRKVRGRRGKRECRVCTTGCMQIFLRLHDATKRSLSLSLAPALSLHRFWESEVDGRASGTFLPYCC